MITDRQKNIIKILLETEGLVTCKEISEKIKASDRTVLNEIKNINNNLSSKNKLVIAKGKGIKLEKKESIFELYRLYTSTDEKEDLSINLIKIILINNYFNQKVYSEEIAEELYISLSVLKRVIKKARIKLKEYQLDIIVDNKKGIYIEGKEENIRLCMSNILFLSSNNYDIFLNKTEFFNKSEIEEIKKITLKFLDKYNLSLTYIAFNSFIIHILISIIRTDKLIDYDTEFIDKLNKSREKDVITELIAEINSKLGYKLDCDFYYLTKHLISSQKFSEDYNFINERNIIDLIFKNIVNRIYREFSIDFSKDKIFTDGLKLHLLTSINRYKINSSIKHIDLSEIKSQYPIAYDMGIVAGDEISKGLNINLDDTEVLFLALHLGTAFNRLNKNRSKKGCSILIVCGAGLSTAKFLKYSLLENFKCDINHIDLISYYDYKQELKDQYDIILSSLNNINDIDGAIKVNYVLTQLELDVLKNKLTSINNKDYLKPCKGDIFYLKSYENKEQVLKFMTEELNKRGLLTKENIKSIYDREEMGDTSLGNMIAIPHPLSYSLEDMNISVLINDKEIFWGKDKVKIILLPLIPKTKIKEWDNLFKKLFKVFSRSDVVDKLSNSSNIEEFKNILIEEME